MHSARRREVHGVSPRALITLSAVAVCWYGLDQVAKYLVVTHLPFERPVEVLGTALQFFYITNSGAAFSIGSGSTWIFSLVGAATLIFVVWYARRIRSLAWATLFGLLLGGLCGNLSDRLLRPPGFGVGRVVDFIKIPVLPAYFNIADVGITASMALFIILTLRGVGLDGRAGHDRASLSEGSGDPGESSDPAQTTPEKHEDPARADTTTARGAACDEMRGGQEKP